MDLSLVVCTRNRARFLAQALAAFRELRADIDWELVVVDNGSTDGTGELLRAFVKTTPFPSRVVEEPVAGLSRARNTGWQAASGGIVAFTDDDCYPAYDFIEKVWRVFSDPEIGFCGGMVTLHDPTDLPITIQLHDRAFAIAASDYIPAGVIHGANFAFRKSVLEKIGGFDELLGAGAPIPSADDCDALRRAAAIGVGGCYDPSITVSHHHRRKSQEQQRSLEKGYSLGRGAYHLKAVLDASARWTYARHWYWALRAGMKRRAWADVSLELRGAMRYLCFRHFGIHGK